MRRPTGQSRHEQGSHGKLPRAGYDKYANRPSFLAIAVRALAYFEDAEQQPMPRMLKPVRWADVRAYCEAAARRLARRLSGLA